VFEDMDWRRVVAYHDEARRIMMANAGIDHGEP
jgi:hypothetical protein